MISNLCRSIHTRIANLDPYNRNRLSHDVEFTLENNPHSESNIYNFQQTIRDIIQQLYQIRETEKFITLRLQSYKSQLQSCRKHFESDEKNSNNDIESISNFKKKYKRQETYKLMVEKLYNIQKIIHITSESLRRRLVHIQDKEKDIQVKRKECEEFLFAVAQQNVRDAYMLANKNVGNEE